MYFNIKKRKKVNREGIILILAVVAAFFVYSYFYLSTETGADLSSPKFNSPDETANYFFAKLYAEEDTLRVFEPLNFLADNKIHPRSMTVRDGYLIPGSFFGMILFYGWIAKIFGAKIILILTPLLASFAVICFYRLILKIFDRRVAFWSALLLLIHPAFWYYSSRGFFPNVLFVSLLLISFYFLLCKDALRSIKFKINGRVYFNYIFAGLFFGLAIAVRLSEIIWTVGVLIVLYLIYRKNLRIGQVALFIIFAALAFAPIFSYNQILYGDPLSTSYNLGGGVSSGGSAPLGWFCWLGQYIFPFGFHPKSILQNFSVYFVGMFWWLVLPLYAGALIFLKKIFDGKLEKRQEIYFWLSGFIALFLFIYYGSWNFYDNPAEVPSIGTSYVRYWLPIYILSVPIIITALSKLVEKVRPEERKFLVGTLAAILFLSSIKIVILDKNEGLAKVKENVGVYTAIAETVNRVSPPESVIIVDRADKIFFPERRVLLPLRDDGTYRLIPNLVNLVPLYYYGVTLPEKDINYLYKNKIDPEVVEIKRVGDFGVESLYKFESRINQESR